MERAKTAKVMKAAIVQPHIIGNCLRNRSEALGRIAFRLSLECPRMANSNLITQAIAIANTPTVRGLAGICAVDNIMLVVESAKIDTKGAVASAPIPPMRIVLVTMRPIGYRTIRAITEANANCSHIKEPI